MSVTQEQIEKLSKNLSKINVDSTKLTDDVNWVLKYVELLNEVDTKWVEPTVSVIESDNTLRKDVEKKKSLSREELLKCSNQKIIADQIALTNIMK